jgi:O-antigen ligase/polysaccharide polymerase Wzy-like membrane protein
MKFRVLNYFSLLLLHILIAVIIFIVPFASKILSIAILLFGIIYVVKKRNRNNEVLYVAAYITGMEVLLRATDGLPVYEFAKYGVTIMIFFGMFYSGFSKNAVPYWVYLLLLIPGVILATFVLNSSMEDRKIISFVISGPVCLGICSLYTYQRKITYDQLQTIILSLGLPILSLTTYLILFNPSVKDVITGTDSNAMTSGGFGPNQVSTALGIGIFVFVMRAILQSKEPVVMIVNICIAVVIAFRGIVTFSRGGIFTAIVMISLLIVGVYFRTRGKAKIKMHYFIIATIIGASLLWSYSLLQTNGLIGKRYSNQDAEGRVKESRFTGREELAESELEAFYEHPLLGVGVGKSIEIREAETGVNAASHNEITRLLAEHGALGVMMLLILFVTPIFLHMDNRKNFFMFPILFFWLLTINHAAMRIAAPAFVYSLALLNVQMGIPAKKRSLDA